MPDQTRAVRLVNQTYALQAFADRLEPDRNEAGILVHEALMTAFVAHRVSINVGHDLCRSVIGGLRLRRDLASQAAVSARS